MFDVKEILNSLLRRNGKESGWGRGGEGRGGEGKGRKRIEAQIKINMPT